jgi:rhodanese-related sulfurtransferase
MSLKPARGTPTMLHDLSPQELYEGLKAGKFILVDVREIGEFNDARIEGAINLPLSNFDPSDLPVVSANQTMVLSCAGGVRSAKAAQLTQGTQHLVSHHLAGGLKAWIGAGLPVI